jgi:hypothetical protein
MAEQCTILEYPLAGRAEHDDKTPRKEKDAGLRMYMVYGVACVTKVLCRHESLIVLYRATFFTTYPVLRLCQGSALSPGQSESSYKPIYQCANTL